MRHGEYGLDILYRWAMQTGMSCGRQYAVSFDSFYEKSEMFINSQVTDTIYRLQKDGMSLETTMSMPLLEQVKWLNFEQMEYGIGIKVYRQLLEKAGIDKDINEIYENYDKIYDACMKKTERKNKAIR